MEKFNYSGAKILVIDDIEEILNSTKNCLEFEGMEVMCIPSPTEGLNYLKNNKADVLLLDFFMSEMNGDKFVEELRKFNNETVIILRTGYSDKIPPLEIIDELNIQGYIDKAKGNDELIMITKSAIKTAFLSKTIKEQKNALNAQEYQNEFLGKFLNRLMGEIAERSMAMGGSIIHLEELQDSIMGNNRELYNKSVETLKRNTSKLNELIKILEIQEISNIRQLEVTTKSLFEIVMSIKNINLNFKYENEYQLLECNSKILLYILVDIIKFLINTNEKEINILIEQEDKTDTKIKICNHITDKELFEKLRKLAYMDEKISINEEYEQIIISVK